LQGARYFSLFAGNSHQGISLFLRPELVRHPLYAIHFVGFGGVETLERTGNFLQISGNTIP
jgi:hypothetical protein